MPVLSRLGLFYSFAEGLLADFSLPARIENWLQNAEYQVFRTKRNPWQYRFWNLDWGVKL